MLLQQSGRSSPLSEITDSAPEEELDISDDQSEPHWTISGIKDEDGRFVLKVHKN